MKCSYLIKIDIFNIYLLSSFDDIYIHIFILVTKSENMEEKIMTLHPEGKKGVNISLEKYSQIKSFILEMISCQGTISYRELNALAKKQLGDVFNGSVPWYIVTVKLDLEARGIIKRVKQKSGHAIALADED